LATGETHSVRELIAEAFACAGLKPEGHIEIDPQFYRPAEVELLVGDPSKAQRVLGWKPTIMFKELVHMMVDSDLSRERHRNR